MAARKITPKVMDITHPSKVNPTLSSKPIIVSNRPMIAADPMISKAAEAAATAGTKKIEISERQQPTTESELPPSAPIITHREKIIMPLSELTEQTESKDPETNVETKMDTEVQAPDVPLTTPELPNTVNDVTPTAEKIIPTTIQIAGAENIEEKIETVSFTQPVQPEQPRLKKTPEPTIEIFTKEDLQKSSGIFKQPSPKVTSNDDKNDEGTLLVSEETTEDSIKKDAPNDTVISKSDDVSKAVRTKISPKKTIYEETDDQLAISTLDEKVKTAEEKQSDEIELIISKGTYALPINQTGKRRERIVLGILVIVLLLAVMLDVMLDLGVVSLPWLPHTTFFSL